MVEPLVRRVSASLNLVSGTVSVKCSNEGCQERFFLPTECLDNLGRIKEGYEIDGVYASGERFPYCSQKCWADFCAD